MRNFLLLLFIFTVSIICGQNENFICGKWQYVRHQGGDLKDSAFYKNLKTMIPASTEKPVYLVLNKDGTCRNEVFGYKMKKGTWAVSTNAKGNKTLGIFGRGKVATRSSWTGAIAYLSKDCLILEHRSKGEFYYVFRKAEDP